MVKTAIKFYADWCGPCKTYDKIWQEVKSEVKSIKFIEIDVDKDTAKGACAEMVWRQKEGRTA